MVSPIKIKICDRNTLMGLSYEWRMVRVEQANGTVVVKNEKDVLKTDTIIAYLPNDYISPLRIKILDINIVYATVETLKLIVDYAKNISEGLAIVCEYINAHIKVKFQGKAYKPLTIYYGRTKSRFPDIKIEEISDMSLEEIAKYTIERICYRGGGMLRFKASIVVALDIFKEMGLFAKFRIKAITSGLTKVWSTSKMKTIFGINILGATRTVYTTIVSKIKHKADMNDAIELYYGYTQTKFYKRIRNISGITIGQITGETTIDDLIWHYGMIIFTAKAKYALAELVHEDEAISRVSQNALADRLLTVNYGINSSDKNTILLSVHGITQGVVKTKKKIKEIDGLTLKDIKDNNMTLDDILYKYS